MRAIVPFLAFAFSGCGSDNNSTPSSAPTGAYALVVQDPAGLPACDGASEGRLAYVKADSKFRACGGGTWTEIDLKGPKGDDGEAGTPGAPGEPGSDGANGADGAIGATGKDGVDNHIVAGITCVGPLEGTTLYLRYHAAQLSSGDVLSTAALSNPTLQASGTSFFSFKQNGFVSAPVSFTFDVEGASNGAYWTISLDRETLVVTARYIDSDLVGGEAFWNMTPDKCVVGEF